MKYVIGIVIGVVLVLAIGYALWKLHEFLANLPPL